ncbi:MAG: hypothetical protein J7513_06340 [Solirubrobacteraceae bacterium]|nr:hypothetical protein [Solirubrobacteraceae bacterium]
MAVLLCKLALAPTFVVLVSVIARRFGPRIGGVVGGLPVVAGPILLVLALQRDDAFAAEAARLSVLALAGLSAFVVIAARAPAAWHACGAVLVGWAAFLAIGALVTMLDLPLAAAAIASAAVFAAGLHWGIPAVPHVTSAASRPPHDLLLRAVTAMVMVVAVTSASGALGPAWSGVLAPFPTVTSVLAGFSLAHDPRPTTQRLLRSMLIGFFSFAAFLATIAATLEPWGTVPAFLAALAVTAAMQAVMLAVAARPSGATEALPTVAEEFSGAPRRPA